MPVPGASVPAVKIGVPPLTLFSTTIFVIGMLPVFVTVPLYVSNPPGATGESGQLCVIDSNGVVTSVQVLLAVFVTATPQMLWPEAVAMLADKQFVGAR